MKTLEELIDQDDPFINVFNEWLSKAGNEVTVLPPSKQREDVLLKVQVTTHSILGSLIYYTGGVLIDNGWLRLLGSGSEVFPRDVFEWNQGLEKGIYLIADDIAGGFYAINGGAFNGDMNIVHYWPPDSLEWESLDLLYSDFVGWLLNGNLDEFYEGLRWREWKEDAEGITTDQCMMFHPPLWAKEGNSETSHRGMVPIKEAFELKCDWLAQAQKST